eukprot:TRINITY_DN16481_c0_g1_i1.p1 TRINITY_DN16481_c0_g1~~TRINITY_DN16481_c0_g1_i1.p1  ORF type:complete len:442 (+),score=62.15 TRINITY_DN16481_c0_g1_i1:74-1327(+)
MFRKTASRHMKPFPVAAKKWDKEETPYTIREEEKPVKSDELRRGARLTTKTVDGKKEFDTYITQDGGRIDFIKLVWPPDRLHVVAATLDEVRVKHGVPWPSLYAALDAQRQTVSLRYIIDSAHPDLANLQTKEGRCSQCISQSSSLFTPFKLDGHVKKFVIDSIYSPIPNWKYTLYCKLIDFGMYRYDAAEFMSLGSICQFTPDIIKDIMSDYEGSTETLLDVGAGNGSATAVWVEELQPKKTSASEISRRLCKALRKKGYETHLTGTVRDVEEHDVVLCLNVLDRCYSIQSMLDEVIRKTKPGGRLIISLPLPLRQVQYRLGEKQEMLWPPSTNKESAWEFAAAWFADYVLQNYGGGSQITLKRVARSPYLADGPAHAPLSVLDAAVFVFDKNIDCNKYRPLKDPNRQKVGNPIVV